MCTTRKYETSDVISDHCDHIRLFLSTLTIDDASKNEQRMCKLIINTLNNSRKCKWVQTQQGVPLSSGRIEISAPRTMDILRICAENI